MQAVVVVVPDVPPQLTTKRRMSRNLLMRHDDEMTVLSNLDDGSNDPNGSNDQAFTSFLSG
jgi:hypothetical protein